ncbi:hypothetical protein CDG60_13965 [Acinetobacter chinensis]|uniref:Uncharacterized protein n=1 Tax=Acinetobacter chinensis TaxID=2004650 RepID=A0A3B7M1D5_9GAMM|nr:hypothetical protein [Acinetobacter chinensis]AXY57567.1 hypothetical protein CDG60_13965 [Acinetobacter chinensis]
MSVIDPAKLKTVSNDKILQVEDGSTNNKPEPSNENLNKQLNSESEELDKQLKIKATQNDHTRDQKWKDHFAFAFICAFWILWLLFIVMCISLIWHWITPASWQWLNTEQLDKIKVIILAALASKAISNKIEKS